MHENETRALRRAATLLIVISVLRWGWSSRDRPVGGAEETVLPELLEASRDAAEEEAHRAAPLGEGELVDPNRAAEEDLDRLPGVGPSTARAIVEAREGGTVFRRPEDLLQVRGIGAATVDRIRGALSFADPPPPSRPSSPRRRATPGPTPELVDVNSADLEALQELPGIGPAIAERILVTRREQAFTSLEDLVRVRGIGPATVERLRPRATVGHRP